MKIYLLTEESDALISASTHKNLIFNKAASLSKKQVKSRSWEHIAYWVHIFDSKTGKKLDELEFNSNGKQEGTFGKIVRERGTRDEKVVGTWNR